MSTENTNQKELLNSILSTNYENNELLNNLFNKLFYFSKELESKSNDDLKYLLNHSQKVNSKYLSLILLTIIMTNEKINK